MLTTELFGEELKSLGYGLFCGVPCSSFKFLLNYAVNDCEYIMSVNEGDAVATCAGAYLGGRKSVALFQNSGLTNALSPLTSLNYIFRIPVLCFVGLRGEKGTVDEPQHELMGEITMDLLDLIRVKWEYLSTEIEEAKEQLKRADATIAENKTFFFVVRKKTFAEVALKEQSLKKVINKRIERQQGEDSCPTRLGVLEEVSKLKDDDTVLLATTGKTGRELYEIEDAGNNLYMVGSMGCVSSLGLGLALAKPDKSVIAIDGDGAVLMRMGAMATTSYLSPHNLLHIVLDNNSYDSTGGQGTVSHMVDFVQVAASAGYTNSFYAHNKEELAEYVKHWQKNRELTFIYLKIAPGSKKDLGRPRVKPFEVKERLMKFLGAGID